MSGSIKGIVVEIGGDTSGLQKALSKVNSQSSSLSKELKGINSLLKLDPQNIELLAQKQTVLNENIENTQDKLTQLKKIKDEADEKMAKGTEISEENYRNLQREIINTERKLNNLTNDLKQFIVENSNWTKVGKKVEQYGDKITKASQKIDEIGNKTSVISGAVVAGGTALANSAMNLDDAVSKYISTTNIAKEETEQYKDILENIYRNNYGEGYEDIANAMSNVKMQLKDLNKQDLQNVTEKAIAFKDLFGYEVSESIRAVKAMMDNFNISAEEAFNLLTEGKKQGLDFSNELLDNVNEYSVQFKKLGLTADDMFNIFKSGAENGAFNLDKIGDAIKEFSIRAIDGSNTTIEGFRKLGLNANTMAKKFAQGGDVAKQAFIEVVQKIGKMDNKVEQSIVGVDLFGTMWEDLGPKVVTSFNKMDNGISKSSNSMQDSIDRLYKTTKKKAEAQLRRLQSLGADFGKEMLPTLEKIIDKAEVFINSLENMSDAEKENILKIGLFVASMGPATKVLGTAGKVIGTTTKGIGTFSQAVGLMGKTSTEAFNNASKGTQIFAKGLTGLTSPIGLVTLAIVGTTLAATALYSETNKNNEAIAQSAKELENSKNKYNELIQVQDEKMNKTLTEVDNTKKLSGELKNLVDENGKVKKGYEDRVSFILNELNQAFGTENKITDGVIENYKELESQINQLILKKQANAILENDEAKYNEARDKRTKSYDNIISKEQELANAKQRLLDKEKEYTEYKDSYWGKTNITTTQMLKTEVELQKEAVKLAEQNLKDSKNIHKNYLNDIATYENDFAIIQSGNNEKIQEMITRRSYTYKQSSHDIGETINHNIQQVQYEVQQYQLSREEDLRNQDTMNAIKNQTQIEAGKQQILNLANQLKQMTSTTEELTPNQKEAWKNMATQSYDIYSEVVSDMDKPLREKIQDMTGVIVVGTPEMQEKSKELGEKTVQEFDKSADAKQKALNTITGYLNGLSDENKRELLKQAGIENVDAVIQELDKGNLSEQNGKNILEGLWKGLNNGTWKGKILGVASGLAKAVNKAFTGKDGWDEHSPSKKMKKYAEYYVQPISDVMKAKQSSILATAKDLANKVNSAFSGKTNTIQIKDFGKIQKNLTNKIIDKTNTVFTTPQIVFNVQELDEAKLQQCFNYVNKKFGSKY